MDTGFKDVLRNEDGKLISFSIRLTRTTDEPMSSKNARDFATTALGIVYIYDYVIDFVFTTEKWMELEFIHKDHRR